MRDVVQVSMGPIVKKAILPHCDPGHSITVLDGIKKRLAVEMPKMLPHYRAQFKSHVDKWLKMNLKPLPPHTDFSIDTWLSNTHYPLYRKQILKRKNALITNPHDSRWKKVKSFIKDETYVDFKHARTINSRTDEFKTLVGPYIKQIEKIVLAGRNFIKYIPKRLRPKALMERLFNKYRYIISNDFSSFEAHFDELLEDTEFKLYEYMFQNIPQRENILKLLKNAMLKWNNCTFKWATVKIWRRRMSGEMSTSLGNGFANLMMITFLAALQGEETDPYVEGDDGITGLNKPPPTKQWIYDNLGWDLKMETCTSLADASFCGNVFDESDLTIITNPVDVICSFGWTTSRYKKCKPKRLLELLRAKSLSLLYEYPGCPILSELAQYGMRMTKNVRARPHFSNEYEREQYAMMIAQYDSQLPIVEPPKNTRILMEKLFKITVGDQLLIEKYFRDKNDLLPIDIPQLEKYLPAPFVDYAAVYYRELPINFKLTTLFAPHVYCC